MDEAIGREVMRLVQPGAVQAAVLAAQQASRQRDEVRAALERDLQAAQYEARRARKQYDAVDPENRLVADELERRWNQALLRVRDLEQRLAAQPGVEDRDRVMKADEWQELANDLETIWNGAGTDVRLKKRIVRTLIQEVIADVDAEAGEVILVIHWRGGIHTELRLPRRRRGQCSRAPAELVAAVRQLARVCSDKQIGGFLNRNGVRTGRGNRWTQMRVTSFRSKHDIPCYCPQQRRAEGWMNLTEAAQLLGISTRTLRLAAERGEIVGDHPLGDGPWIFSPQQLQTDTAQQAIERARKRRGTVAVPNPDQQTFDFS